MRDAAVAALVVALVTVSGCGRTPLDERVFGVGLAFERGRAGFERRTIELADGYRLAYLERPADGDTIVLLHGFASEKDAWTRFARHIPDSYRVLAFDLPGHGDSARAAGDTHDVAYLVARLEQGFDAVGLDRFHIAGNSLGGMAALLYAHAHPDRVLSLGLFAAAGVDPPHESEFERRLAAGDNPLIVDSRDGFDALMALVFEDPPPMPWPVGAVLARRFAGRAAFHEKMWQDIWSRRQAITGLLPEVATPALVLWGDSDRVLDPSSVGVFMRWLPRAQAEVLVDTGHSPMVERPARAAEVYLGFVERVRRSGRESAGSGGG